MTWYQATGLPLANTDALSLNVRNEFTLIEESWNRIDPLDGRGGWVLQVTHDERIAIRSPADAGIVTALTDGWGVKVETTGTGVATATLDLSVGMAEDNSIGSSHLVGFISGVSTEAISLEDFRTALNVVNVQTGLGLDGGGNAGDVELDLNIYELPLANALSANTDIVFWDVSANAHKKTSFANFKASLNLPRGGSDLTQLVTADGLRGGVLSGPAYIALDLHELAAENAIASDDLIPFATGGNNRRITRANFKTSINIDLLTFGVALDETLNGTQSTVNLSWHTQPDLPDAPADMGDLFIVETSDGLRKITRGDLRTTLTPPPGLSSLVSGDGIAVEGTTYRLDIHGLDTTATTIASTDFLAFAQTGLTGSPTKKITHADFADSLNIPEYVIGTGVVLNGSALQLACNEYTDEDEPTLQGYLVIEDASVTSGNKDRRVALQTVRDGLNIPAVFDNFEDPTFANGLSADGEGVVAFDVSNLESIDTVVAADQLLAIEEDDTSHRIDFSEVESLIDYPTKRADDGLRIVNDLLSFHATSLDPTTNLIGTDYVTIVTQAGLTRKILLSDFFTSIQSMIAKAPDAPVLTISGGNLQLVVTWTIDANASAITGFNVEYRKVGTSQWINANHAGTARKITIPNLEGAVEYEVRVQGINGIGTGSFGTANGTTLGEGPEAPELTLVRGDQYIDTSYTEPDDGGSPILRYELEYRAVGTTAWIPVTVNLLRAKRIPNLVNGTTYEVRVRAVNAIEPSAYDLETAKPATTPGTATPALTRGAQQIVSRWALPSNGGEPITGVDVDYREVGAMDWIPSLVDTLATSHTIPNLTDGDSYEVRLKFKNAVGYGVYGNFATTQLTSPIPGNRNTTGITSSIFVGNWSASNGATYYKFRHREVGADSWIEVNVGNVLLKQIPNLDRATDYEWQVLAGNPGSESAWSASVNVTTLATAPDRPDAPSLAYGNRYLNATVVHPNNGGSPITGGTLQYSTRNNFRADATSEIALSATALIRQIPNLQNGRRYYVRVKFENDIGESVYSASSSAIPRTLPSISGYSITRGVVFFKVNANVNNGGVAINRHEVRYKIGSSNSFTTINSSSSNFVNDALGIFIKGLTKNTRYRDIQYRVRNSVGWSSWTSGVSITTYNESDLSLSNVALAMNSSNFFEIDATYLERYRFMTGQELDVRVSIFLGSGSTIQTQGDVGSVVAFRDNHTINLNGTDLTQTYGEGAPGEDTLTYDYNALWNAVDGRSIQDGTKFIAIIIVNNGDADDQYFSNVITYEDS